MRLLAFGVLVLALAGAGCSKKTEPTPALAPEGVTAPASDKDRFQGVWVAESVETAKGLKEMKGDRVPRLQVEGDRVSLRESAVDPGEPFAAVWDPSKSPKTLALTPFGFDGKPRPGGEPMMCIYKFDGDTLVFAQGFGLAPTDFKPDGGVNVIRFKKSDEKPVTRPAKPTGPPNTRR